MAKPEPKPKPRILGARATMTSKGQVTIPKVFRELFDMEPGMKIDFSLDPWGNIVLSPINGKLEDLIGMLPKPDEPLTLEDMDDAIAEAVADKVLRGS
jgi:antitoxin PrlF